MALRSIKKEDGWETVFDVLSETVSGKATVFMHELNLLEVYYGFYKERGREYAEQKMAEASAFFVTISGLTKAAFAEAGRLKAGYKMSLADSYQSSIKNPLLWCGKTAENRSSRGFQPPHQFVVLIGISISRSCPSVCLGRHSVDSRSP